ncbi:copper amine oxidase [Clostridium sp. 'deep sea']|uniref:CAP-associated domain-containing protein n=1 Tax=Clostridium sp. 'deep sea' TaxID=2779445 RepID=UPI0018968A18|nr:CAP-associated domain-containing protein [Clostridium sp. 'deep sea']QOR36567.1 copper amine oxidase [Clostridium sp. 'deep sea']
MRIKKKYICILLFVLLTIPAMASSVHQRIAVLFNDSQVYVNNKPIAVNSMTYEGTLYVPLREVSQLLNKEVVYDSKNKIAHINDKKDLFSELKSINSAGINGVNVGMSKDELIDALGLPNRVDTSIHGFTWYVYNKNLEKYVQAGVKDNEVIAVYSNIGDWDLEHSVKLGLEKSIIDRKLGSPLPTFEEGNKTYTVTNNDGMALYKFNKQLYAYIFYDIYHNNTVTGMMMWDKKLPFNDIYIGNYDDFDSVEWQKAMSKQMFDLNNTIRIRNSLNCFEWDNNIASVAYSHSCDMAKNKYFDHTNKKGKTPFDRLTEHGLKYVLASENIAKGQRNSIFAFEALMNSKSHRDNILGNYSKLGVGVFYYDGDKKAYYTQNFITPSLGE